VRLTTGENVISVVATDILGNRAERTVRLILDTEPPSLVVLYPSDGYLTEQTTINVSGRADVGSNVTINGEPIPLDDKGLFDHEVSLKMGRQTINVTATDQASNEATVSMTVERIAPEEPVEPTPPPSTGGSTAAILAALLILAIGVGVGWMYFQQRKKRLQQ
jgi:hypothetical protein